MVNIHYLLTALCQSTFSIVLLSVTYSNVCSCNVAWSILPRPNRACTRESKQHEVNRSYYHYSLTHPGVIQDPAIMSRYRIRVLPTRPNYTKSCS